MHDGCSSSFSNGKDIINKLRMMGFSDNLMPLPMDIKCECGNIFEMETFEAKCEKCNMVYGVTPCHAFDSENVMPAGINY